MFARFRSIFTANRMAALVTFVAAAGGFVATLQTSFVPGSPGQEALGKAAVMIALAYKAVTLVEKFLEGSQNWDSLMTVGVPKVAGATVINNNTEFSDTIDADVDDLGQDPETPDDTMADHPLAQPARLSGFDGERDAPDADQGYDPGNPPQRPE